MSYFRKNVELVNKEYEEKRAKNSAIQRARLREVYEACPEIEQIDNELSKTGLKIFAVATKGKDALDSELAIVRKENEELLARRAFLLVKHGFTRDYTDPIYDCADCCDTGYIDAKMCPCYKHALTIKSYESSGIANLLKKQSFESFSLDMYPENARPAIKKNYDKLKKYVDNFENDKTNFLLVGDTGLGKTHLSTSVAKELVDRGYFVVYEIAQNIFADFESDYFRDRFSDTEMLSERYLECELLIIDDLGTEIVTNRSLSYLYNIINTRLNKNLPIIINTNLSGKDIEKLYNERIVSRLFGEFYIVKFEGLDVRKTKIKK
jgi:DNA replication protein DnaC